MPNFIIFFEQLFILLKNICAFFLKHYTQGHNFFRIIFVSSKKFKTFFNKKNLVRYYYSINVYVMFWDWDFVSVKLLFLNFNIAKRYNFFTYFIYGNNLFLFYNSPWPSVKLAFCSKFTASFFLIPLIIQQ